MRNWHWLKMKNWTVPDGLTILLGFSPTWAPIKLGDDLEICAIRGATMQEIGRLEAMLEVWDSDPEHHGKRHFPAEYFIQWAERTGFLPEDEWAGEARRDGVLIGSPLRIAPVPEWRLHAAPTASAPSEPPAPAAELDAAPSVRAMKTPQANALNAVRALQEAKKPDGSPMFDLMAIPEREGRKSPAKQYLMQHLGLSPDAAKMALSALVSEGQIKYADPVKKTR